MAKPDKDGLDKVIAYLQKREGIDKVRVLAVRTGAEGPVPQGQTGTTQTPTAVPLRRP